MNTKPLVEIFPDTVLDTTVKFCPITALVLTVAICDVKFVVMVSVIIAVAICATPVFTYNTVPAPGR